MKRAQIFIADLWLVQKEAIATDNFSSPPFHNMHTLTMFADYRVPQALVTLGAMHYSDEMMRELKECAYVECGSEMEIEIRAASVHAVQVIKKHVK